MCFSLLIIPNDVTTYCAVLHHARVRIPPHRCLIDQLHAKLRRREIIMQNLYRDKEKSVVFSSHLKNSETIEQKSPNKLIKRGQLFFNNRVNMLESDRTMGVDAVEAPVPPPSTPFPPHDLIFRRSEAFVQSVQKKLLLHFYGSSFIATRYCPIARLSTRSVMVQRWPTTHANLSGRFNHVVRSDRFNAFKIATRKCPQTAR